MFFLSRGWAFYHCFGAVPTNSVPPVTLAGTPSSRAAVCITPQPLHFEHDDGFVPLCSRPARRSAHGSITLGDPPTARQPLVFARESARSPSMKKRCGARASLSPVGVETIASAWLEVDRRVQSSDMGRHRQRPRHAGLARLAVRRARAAADGPPVGDRDRAPSSSGRYSRTRTSAYAPLAALCQPGVVELNRRSTTGRRAGSLPRCRARTVSARARYRGGVRPLPCTALRRSHGRPTRRRLEHVVEVLRPPRILARRVEARADVDPGNSGSHSAAAALWIVLAMPSVAADRALFDRIAQLVGELLCASVEFGDVEDAPLLPPPVTQRDHAGASAVA